MQKKLLVQPKQEQIWNKLTFALTLFTETSRGAKLGLGLGGAYQRVP